MLTARGGESDRVDGLQAGADDYLPKPFSVRELLARCEALLRRASWDREPPSTTLRVGGATIDLGRLEIVGEGEGDPIALTAREAEILSYLAGREGRVASKRELLLDVWGYPDVPIETRTVENTVGVLRRKLDSAVGESGPAVIVTVRGAGFKLANEVDVACGG
jgi:DNA-binding response OmpR family regulator